MQTAFFGGHHRITQILSILTLAAFPMVSGGCAGPASETLPAPPLPAPGTVEIVQPLELAERARVPEKETGFVAAEVGENQIVIIHDGRLPAFAAGDVIVGTQGGGYLARVRAARAMDETHVALETEPAALTELLTEGEIHVHYDAEAHARQLREAIAQQEPLDEEDGERIGSQAQALTLGAGAPIQLIDLVRAALPASCGIPADSEANIDVTATFSPVLDIDLKIGSKEGANPLPELKRFRLVASGELDVSARLEGAGTIERHCNVNLLGLGPFELGIPLPTLTFWAGPVPIVVSTMVVPTATADIELAFDAAEVMAEAHTTAQLEAGVEYEDKTWNTIWEPSCAATGTVTAQAPGAIAASCTVSAGAELQPRLYGVLGPNLGIQAYARAQAETAPPYCTYEGWIDGGVRAYAGAALSLSVGPLGLTLAELELVNLELVHFDGPQLEGQLSDAPECSSRH